MSHIFIATPMYGPSDSIFDDALLPGVQALERAGHTVTRAKFEGCCYVHIARNKLVRQFLATDADDMLFWDADVAILPDELVRLCGRDKPLIGGAAPFRMGLFGFPVHPIVQNGQVIREPDGLIRVDVLPTAVMKIHRDVFAKLTDAGKAPRRMERAPDSGEVAYYRSYFDFEYERVPDHGDEAYIEYGEDVSFCRKWTALGGEIWLDPDMTISHAGRLVRQANYLNYLALMHEEAEKQKAAAEVPPAAVSSAA